jgi:hypothetical protein
MLLVLCTLSLLLSFSATNVIGALHLCFVVFSVTNVSVRCTFNKSLITIKSGRAAKHL